MRKRITPIEDMTEPELKKLMSDVASAIDSLLPNGTGFVVLASSFDGSIAQYVSNVNRDDSAKWMAETIERWKAGDYVSR